MAFVEMLIKVRSGAAMTQKEFAAVLGFSAQYLCDLEKGRRLGSVEFVDRLCDWMMCKPHERKAWHRAGAKAHGWQI